MTAVLELLANTRRIAERAPFWVQGAGGNTSVKAEENGVVYLWVKSSGARLDAVVDESYFSKLALKGTVDALDRIVGSDNAEAAYAEALRVAALSGKRPSMETGLHVYLPRKYVFHFHSLPAVLMAHQLQRQHGKMEPWLKDRWDGGFEFVEPCMPGWMLTNRLKKSGRVALILLANHGLILQSDDARILDRWQALETQFCREWKYALDLAAPLPAAPLRIYFPDTAVFLERLRAVLKPVGNVNDEPVYQLASRAREKDRDAVEIWEATALLYKACPALESLPEDIASRVAGLPTEQFRRSLGGSRGA